MLTINRLRIIIRTLKGDYGFDGDFKSGLNIITSDDNTSGKSSIINGLYYVLGFEQLIEGSGVGSKTLSRAFTKLVKIDDEDSGAEAAVLESEIQTEISNGQNVVTIRRFAKSDTRKDNLVTVFNSEMKDMYNSKTVIEEMYVNMPGAAQNLRGFHRYLEDFLGMELPEVSASNGLECKLYLQSVFGACFIEQKHGWAGFLNGVPYLGVADVKKRVVEYILGLSSLANEKAKKKFKQEEERVQNEWRELCFKIQNIARNNGIDVQNLPYQPIVASEELQLVNILKRGIDIPKYLIEQKEIAQSLISVEKIDESNRSEIEKQVKLTQESLLQKQINIESIYQSKKKLQISIEQTTEALELIEIDLLNNKEAKRLRELGAQEGIEDFEHKCPTCGQEINDTLLNTKTVMSIEQNIAHLQNQEKLFQYTLQGQNKTLKDIENDISVSEEEINNLRKLQRVLMEDLVKVRGDYSSAKVYQRIKIEEDIEKTSWANEQIAALVNGFKLLCDDWKKCLEMKAKLCQGVLSNEDKDTLTELGDMFAKLLQEFRYKSTEHFEDIAISTDTFLPTIDGFDMKYDSSASDELRSTWAFTLALLQISNKKQGNHPKILIYDEPKQQSVVDDSFRVLCDKLLGLGNGVQIIMGVTAFDEGVKKVLNDLDDAKFNQINIGNRAFKLLHLGE